MVIIKRRERIYIDTLEKQLRIQKKYIDELRAMKHDMYAHLMVINHYLGIMDVQKAQEYIAKLMQIPTFQKSGQIDVGNEVVNALLTRYIYDFDEEVNIVVSGVLPEACKICDMDLCILFSNLISNALEASKKVEGREKSVVLTLEASKEIILIEIWNPVAGELDMRTFGEKTSKEDSRNHGYGVKNIKKVVKKYGGSISFCNENGMVGVKIAFS